MCAAVRVSQMYRRPYRRPFRPPMLVVRACNKHNYSAVFEKVSTSGEWGLYISSQCCLRSTQWPPGGSMGVVNSGNALSLNSWTSACGRSVRSRREAQFVGTMWESCAAHGEPPQSRLSL